MRIGFKIILDRNVTIKSPKGFEYGATNEITVEINEFATPYEEIMQDIYDCPDRAHRWKEHIQYAADKIVEDFKKINSVSDLYRKNILFYIIQNDEYTNYIVNFYRFDCTINRVEYNLVDVD
jgi:hypothetical protein